MAVDKGKNDPLLEFICTPFNPPNESVVESWSLYGVSTIPNYVILRLRKYVTV